MAASKTASARTSSAKSGTSKTTAKVVPKATPKPKAKAANTKPQAAKTVSRTAPKAPAKTPATNIVKLAASATASPDKTALDSMIATDKTGADSRETSIEASAQVTPTLKVRDLVALVATATGAKKKGLKEVVEATLAAMGDALSRGDDLNLPPLGKAKVGRQVDQGGAEMIVVKLKRGGGKGADKKGDKEALAVTED